MVITHDFGDFELTRKFREGIYHVQVKNPKQVEKGVVSLCVDGQEIAGNVIPYVRGKKEYQVEVTLG